MGLLIIPYLFTVLIVSLIAIIKTIKLYRDKLVSVKEIGLELGVPFTLIGFATTGISGIVFYNILFNVADYIRIPTYH